MLSHLTRILVVGAALAVPASASAHSKTDVTVPSKKDDVGIVISVYKPDSASAENPVPVILDSHGWAGSRQSSPDAFKTDLDRGYGVVSIDQRGHGASGGEANVEDPDFEGQDMISVIDYVAGLDWVAKDAGTGIPEDPVLFAQGGSYGGGYQFVAAFTELRDFGYTRLNALAPEITWFNLSESLAPSKVVRTAWVTLLYAVGAQNVPEYIHRAFAYGASTGTWPDGTAPEPLAPNMEAKFFEHGPSGHVAAGRKLDIPVLIGQGTTDTLFNLNQGWKNFEQALTPEARARSLFVGYNGGHVLPSVAPAGTGAGGDACSGEGGFSGLRRRFFDAVRDGQDSGTLLPAKYNMTTADKTECVRTERLDVRKPFDVGVDVEVTRGTMSTTGAGAPQYHEIAKGPLTLSGIPTLDATVSTAGVEQRLFFGIAVGTSAADAKLVQNNMMPMRQQLPTVRERKQYELAGLAVNVPEGQNAYLLVSPIQDTYFGHGSLRTPGFVGLEDITVNLPVVQQGAAKKAKKARKGKRRKAAARKRRR